MNQPDQTEGIPLHTGFEPDTWPLLDQTPVAPPVTVGPSDEETSVEVPPPWRPRTWDLFRVFIGVVAAGGTVLVDLLDGPHVGDTRPSDYRVTTTCDQESLIITPESVCENMPRGATVQWTPVERWDGDSWVIDTTSEWTEEES